MFDYGFLLRSTFRGTRDKTMAALGRNRQMKLVKKLNKHAQKLLKHEKLHISEESTPVILSVFYAFDDSYILVVCFQLFDLSTIFLVFGLFVGVHGNTRLDLIGPELVIQKDWNAAEQVKLINQNCNL